MFMLLLFALLGRIAESTSFFPPFFLCPEISSFWWTSTAITPSGTQKILPIPRGEKVLNWVISSDFLPFNDPHTHTLLHRSFGSRSFPDIFFGDSSVALSCSWEVLQDLGSDHLPILQTVPFFSGLLPQRASPFLQFSESLLGWLRLLLWLSVSFSRGILISFSFLCCCSLYFSDNKRGLIFHSFRPHQTPS